jgi:hypothetical protein
VSRPVFQQSQVSILVFPSIPFLFQKQKTKKGVEILAVAVVRLFPTNINTFNSSPPKNQEAFLQQFLAVS